MRPKRYSRNFALVSNDCEMEYCTHKLVFQRLYLRFGNIRLNEVFRVHAETADAYLDTNTWTKLPSSVDMVNNEYPGVCNQFGNESKSS